MDLIQTPLAQEHKKLGAVMGPFGGWLMPIQYAGIIAEHTWTRQQVCVFDICHMGEFLIHGDPCESNLERIVTVNVSKMAIGSCRYCSMLNEAGGIIDDLIVYRLKADEWMLVVNAARIDVDERNLRKHLSADSKLENVSSQMGKLDLQGPSSLEVLKRLLGAKIAGLQYYAFDQYIMLGEKGIISRTGYTGERGYELYLRNERIVELWNLLLKDPLVKPAGLGARDTLRLEMGYTLYGQDISEESTPLEADLEKFVDFNKDFVGREALLAKKKKGVCRKLVYFVTDSRRNPRHNYAISIQGIVRGIVTSGSFSPSLSCGIGMGFVESGFNGVGSKILIKHDTIEINATITEKPFYKKGSVRKN